MYLTDQDFLAVLAQRMRQARINAELTRTELAQKAGISEYTVKNLESGHDIKLSTLFYVSKVLGLLGDLEPLVAEILPRADHIHENQGKLRQRVRKKPVASDFWDSNE